MESIENILENLFGELKRGTLVLSVLLKTNKPIYGYSLVQTLQESGIKIDKNTLYPLLRRLEKQGLLTSSWDTSENRARKYYEISEMGREILTHLIKEWKEMNHNINDMLDEEE
jgi:DNA-binding PadR family transcriptional regulator